MNGQRTYYTDFKRNNLFVNNESMKKLCFIISLCFVVTSTLIAQQVNVRDSLVLSTQYIIQDSVLITTRDGAKISALVVQKKDIDKPQVAILVFTIYVRKTDIAKAMEAADRGYVGVVAYTRGKQYSPNEIMPYEHDGEDVYDVINWITKQKWSNQKVGMYGGSYNGFAQWAATKHLHPALKTIVPSAAAAPGLDVPMMNNVFMNFPFSWTYYVTNNKTLDNDDYNSQKWNQLDRKWFDAGTNYRSLDSLLVRPQNKLFNRWLNHPSYDKYWQAMIPYKNDFSKIDIPVLTTTGYYDGGQIGALYYLREHTKYNRTANHYLIIGPYGHFGSQGYPDTVYNGYKIDEVANIPIHDIIYQWFDYIFKGGVKPPALKDKVNYQLMGTNEWKSASSLKKTSNDSLTFYLSTKGSGTLTQQKPLKKDYSTLEIDFADRTQMNSYYYAFRIIWDSLFNGGGIMYKSDPLKEGIEFTGSFSGQMHVSMNKRDMDYSAALFEQMPDGRYFYLTYYMGRASYANDNTKRKLLIPGNNTILPFSNSYFTSKKLSKGSRLVLIMNVNKSASEQINYGTGKDVNDETIKDAQGPLKIKWYNDSFIKIPIWK